MQVGGRDAVHHCMTRTVIGEMLFEKDWEKEVLRRMIWQVAAFSGVEILTYCIMLNHFHVLVRGSEGAALSDAALCMLSRRNTRQLRLLIWNDNWRLGVKQRRFPKVESKPSAHAPAPLRAVETPPDARPPPCPEPSHPCAPSGQSKWHSPPPCAARSTDCPPQPPAKPHCQGRTKTPWTDG